MSVMKINIMKSKTLFRYSSKFSQQKQRLGIRNEKSICLWQTLGVYSTKAE